MVCFPIGITSSGPVSQCVLSVRVIHPARPGSRTGAVNDISQEGTVAWHLSTYAREVRFAFPGLHSQVLTRLQMLYKTTIDKVSKEC